MAAFWVSSAPCCLGLYRLHTTVDARARGLPETWRKRTYDGIGTGQWSLFCIRPKALPESLYLKL